MTTLPSKAKVVIIGGGIHGLSTAWKLSETYKNPGDIIVLEKKDTAAGASGIACGVVRNNYFQPAMRELMACLLYTSPSPRDLSTSRMPSSA